MDNGVGGSMSTANSAVSRRAVGGVSNQFPAGLRVLVVDDDPTCLKIMEKMLKNCLYEATTCSRAEIALSMLRESKTGFDVVISDVHMPDMDGFKLLEHIGLEMDLPVIMMSADDGKDVVMKGVTHGACDYLIKPVRIEALRNIWQHVVRKRRNELKESEQSGGADDSNRQQKPLEDADYASSANEGSWKSTKKRKDEEDDGEDRDDTSTLKKPRVVWSVELHQQFVQAVNQLGIDKAVPKKILELMNVPGLTRENVASHLQKYRLYLRRLSGVSQHQSGLNTPFIGSQEANFGSISSLSGLDLQAFSVSGQILPQSLATLQAGGLGRSTATAGINMSLVDQRNLFSSEMPKLRFGAGQQLSNNNKQLNLLHGLPTTMEPKQLAHLHQSVQPFGNIGLQTSEGVSSFLNLPPSLRATSSAHGESVHGNQSSSLMMQLAEPRSRGQLLNEVSGGQASGLPSSIGQQLFSTEAVGRALGINGTLLNGRGAAYNPVSQAASGATYNPVSQAASVVDFPINHITELPGNSFPLVTTAGVPTLALTGMYQGGGSLDVKGSRSFPPSYNIFNEFRQGKTQDWELQNVGLTFEASQHATSVQGNLDLSSPPSSHQDFASSQKNGQSRNISVVGKAMVSLREDNKHGNPETIAQYNSNLLVNNPVRVKAESVPNFSRETVLLGEHFSQDDLSALFKQQQEGSVESDFSFDGYTMDNIPV